MANSTIQQLPLAKKLSPAQRERRERRIQARVTVAEALAANAKNQNLAIWLFSQTQQKFNTVVAIVLALLAIIAIVALYRTF